MIRVIVHYKESLPCTAHFTLVKVLSQNTFFQRNYNVLVCNILKLILAFILAGSYPDFHGNFKGNIRPAESLDGAAPNP